MTRILRFLILLVLFVFARALLRSLFQGLRSAGNQPMPRREPPATPAGGELKKDPVCGTYVSAAGGLTKTIDGQVYHFCSPECRDKYAVKVG